MGLPIFKLLCSYFFHIHFNLPYFNIHLLQTLCYIVSPSLKELKSWELMFVYHSLTSSLIFKIVLVLFVLHFARLIKPIEFLQTFHFDTFLVVSPTGLWSDTSSSEKSFNFYWRGKNILSSLGKPSKEKICFCLEFFQTALTLPLKYFWMHSRNFVKTLFYTD